VISDVSPAALLRDPLTATLPAFVPTKPVAEFAKRLEDGMLNYLQLPDRSLWDF